jgi:UPF0716 protein FxsA
VRWVTVVGALLVATLVVEVVVFVLVAQWIGLAWALGIALATTLLGGWLLRREGVRAWRRFRDAVQAERPPGRPATDGVVGLAGALMLTAPGFVSDLVGLVLLLPPSRRLAGGAVQRVVERRMSPALAGDIFGPRRVRARRGPTTSRNTAPDPVRTEDNSAEKSRPKPADALPAAIEGEVLPPADEPGTR